MGSTPALQIVDAGGEPFARGRAIGQALAPRIAAHLDAWQGWLARVTRMAAPAYVDDMLRATSFEDAIEAHTPDLMDEVRGMAEGAAVEPPLLYALQLMDEEWFHRRRAGLVRRTPDKCSSLAIVTDGGPTWIGQNMDLGDYTDGHQVALRIAPHGGRPGALIFTTAGVIALMGVNDAGVGVCVNSLPQLPAAPSGLPVAFMVRRLLQARTLGEAADLVQSIPHATNQHYVIAEPGAVRAFEASAAGVTEYRPANPRRVLHTNHPLAEVLGEPETPGERANSDARLRSLTDRLSAAEPTLAVLQAALSACDDPANPVCRTGGAGDIGFTCGSMLSALPTGGGPIRSWISAGPPTRGYVEVELPTKVSA